MNNLKDKLSTLMSDQPSDWKAKAKYRRENREWLMKSAAIRQPKVERCIKRRNQQLRHLP
jgi:hypothetical protein